VYIYTHMYYIYVLHICLIHICITYMHYTYIHICITLSNTYIHVTVLDSSVARHIHSSQLWRVRPRVWMSMIALCLSSQCLISLRSLCVCVCLRLCITISHHIDSLQLWWLKSHVWINMAAHCLSSRVTCGNKYDIGWRRLIGSPKL